MKSSRCLKNYICSVGSIKQMIRLFCSYFVIQFIAISASHAETKILSQTLSQVGSHVVTSREILLNTLIEQELFQTDVSKQTAAEKLSGVMLEWAVFLEAQSFSATHISQAETEKALKTIKLSLKPDTELSKLMPSDQELENIVKQKLVSKEFIKFKTSSSLVPVSDEEALIYYQKNKAKFGQAPYETFKDNIKRYLAQQESDRRLKDWFEILQKKHKIRLFSPQGQVQ